MGWYFITHWKNKTFNIEQPWHLDGKFNLLGLQLEEAEIGDLQGVIDWNPKENGLFTDIKIESGSYGEVDYLVTYFRVIKKTNST